MSLDPAPKSRRRSNIAFALETTTGTVATLMAADGVTNAFNADTKFTTEKVERQSQGTSLSKIRQGRGARSGTVTFQTELVAGSSGMPVWTRLLQACGFVNASGVWTPTSAPTQTITIGHYVAGRLRKLCGCMGTFTLTLKRGQAGLFNWTFTGVQEPETDTANIAPTYIKVIAPRMGASLTVNSVTPRVDQIVLDAGNNVVLREDTAAVDSAGDPTGYRAAYITDRNVTFKFSPEATALAVQDFNTIFRASTLVGLSAVIGVDVGNTFTLAAPKLQLDDHPQDADRNSLLVDDLTWLATRSADVGDDEVSLTIA